MVFCNEDDILYVAELEGGHNPYFNRWFSAIMVKMELLVFKQGHNPYFNRWFSAIGI